MSRALLSAVLAAAALALAGTPVPSRDRLRLASPTILVSPVRTGAGRWAWLRSRVLAAGLAATAGPVLAATPAGSPLSDDEVEEIARIGDNTGSMALKGASPEHEGESRPDRWPLTTELQELASRWGIEPERDLRKTAA